MQSPNTQNMQKVLFSTPPLLPLSPPLLSTHAPPCTLFQQSTLPKSTFVKKFSFLISLKLTRTIRLYFVFILIHGSFKLTNKINQT